MIAEDTRPSIRGEENGSYGFNTSGIIRHELPKKTLLTTRQIKSVNFSRKFSRTVHVNRVAIGAPSDWLLTGFETTDGMWLATCGGIEITLLIRPDNRDGLTVRRNKKGAGIKSLGRK